MLAHISVMLEGVDVSSQHHINSFIHSFILQCLFKYPNTQKRSQHSTDTVSEFHAEVPQATASERLAQGPYGAAKVGFEPTTLLTKGIKSTNEPPRPTINALNE